MASENPFAQEPDPEENAPWDNGTAQTSTPTSDYTEEVYTPGEVGLTLKFANERYEEAPWLTFKTDSLEGLADLIGLDRKGLSGADLLEGVVKYATFAQKMTFDTYRKTIKPQARPAGNGGGVKPGQPKESVEPPEWMGNPPLCKGHEEPTKYVTKKKANGDRWHAWGCTRPEGESCGLIFKNKPKSN